MGLKLVSIVCSHLGLPILDRIHSIRIGCNEEERRVHMGFFDFDFFGGDNEELIWIIVIVVVLFFLLVDWDWE